ncbi:hypothetical protein E2C01_015882 [Portunus trituberculatus]|uniref:Uncharacterized protein n=1 Tax=Portunus trituberculatus TaxID=210409 RepID=A0A5B7DNS7_PORTR|nr:hypothetical protein [Portunus trituberculatus]
MIPMYGDHKCYVMLTALRPARPLPFNPEDFLNSHQIKATLLIRHTPIDVMLGVLRSARPPH